MPPQKPADSDDNRRKYYFFPELILRARAYCRHVELYFPRRGLLHLQPTFLFSGSTPSAFAKETYRQNQATLPTILTDPEAGLAVTAHLDGEVVATNTIPKTKKSVHVKREYVVSLELHVHTKP